MNEISLLIGAGFSAPGGYPIGKELNNRLLNSRNENIAFHSSGSLVVNKDGTKPDLGFKSSHQIEFEFCCDLMDFYKREFKYFDYEEFYDYINDKAEFDPNINSITKPYISDTITKHSLVGGLKKVINQLVVYYLRNKENKIFYDDEPYLIGREYFGYTGIMNCISSLGVNNILNIHTLNHDLLFERFNKTDFLEGNLCDGFEEPGSEYYGKLNIDNRTYMVRLAKYTGNYKTNIRLFKLHGSFDYELFYSTRGGALIPDIYIKTRYGIGHTGLYKEVLNEKGQLSYQNSWINYHSDFLSGTSSKIKRYNEPLLFSKLFKCFEENLNKSYKIIIIGYGGKDVEINKMIFQDFDFMRKKIYIIDPYPRKLLIDFGLKLNANFITKHLEDVSSQDLD